MPTPTKASLDDKYTQASGRVFLSGIQALVRLPMLQQARDCLQGKNTAGFISGYRGSPLGGYDLALEKARPFLDAQHIVFQPGVNEDLAATAVWGSQQLGFAPPNSTKFDGVFGIWYGKGPGVDRSIDVFKHANMAGTAPWGGVLAVAGDDHMAKSSTAVHQSDHDFKACGFPVFFPANPQEILDLGLHGFALSRYAGIWAGLKTIQDVVESSSTVDVSIDRVTIQTPTDFLIPDSGVHIRWPDDKLLQEERLLNVKWYAALAYIRANRLNYNVIASANDRLGLITSGKSYNDTRQALRDLGLDDATCHRIGLRLHKVGVVWPLEAQLTRDFAIGLQEILVIEEKRQIMEYQLKEELYNWRPDVRPVILGKFNELPGDLCGGEWSMPNPMSATLLRAHMDLNPKLIARAIATRLFKLGIPDDVKARMEQHLNLLDATERRVLEITQAQTAEAVTRTPWFCSGCPHNQSTKLPEGSFVTAGIGCHYMVLWMNRGALGFTQMGGEGVPWTGQQPFSKLNHMFANLGDGTYFHSGILAIRQSIVSNVNITYKILYNDAVAMTGGQTVGEKVNEKESPWVAGHTVPQIAQSLVAEGVKRIVILSDDPKKYQHLQLPQGIPVLDRSQLDSVQHELREVLGTTALIYDQTCATEKRRRRKRGKLATPPKRVLINTLVCEGCGDCTVQSNCLSVEPIETEFGRKRQINQSSCNLDYSCINGFCPSFVSVIGGKLKSSNSSNLEVPSIVDPSLPEIKQEVWGILVAGIGGTGVVTIGQLLGTAAFLEGLGVVTQDCAGLAQKGGATWSHVLIGKTDASICTTHVGEGSADLLLACDPIVSASSETLGHLDPLRSHIALNTHAAPTASFLDKPDWQNPGAHCEVHLQTSVSPQNFGSINADALAKKILGDGIFANPLLLGFAWQKGWIPLKKNSIQEAMRLNGVKIQQNLAAFEWGRLAAHDPQMIVRLTAEEKVIGLPKTGESIETLITRRTAFLTEYQNASYAQQYQHLLTTVLQTIKNQQLSDKLAKVCAHNLFKLMAIKDEYEVARLFTGATFQRQLAENFEGDYQLQFHLAPPFWAKRDKQGKVIKSNYGNGTMFLFKWLAKMKFLRGSFLDIFKFHPERRREKAWLKKYQSAIVDWGKNLNAHNYDHFLQLAAIPEKIRGYGFIKEKAMSDADVLWENSLSQASPSPDSTIKAA